jgi:hypothetical protein
VSVGEKRIRCTPYKSLKRLLARALMASDFFPPRLREEVPAERMPGFCTEGGTCRTPHPASTGKTLSAATN